MIENALKPDEVAKALGVTTRTLANWRRDSIGPDWFTVGPKLIRYWPTAVHEWAKRSLEVAENG